MSSACALPGGPGGIDDFREILSYRMNELYYEEYFQSNQKEFVLPVGLLLVVDEANGGDVTARELFKRFNLLNSESQNIIDFYFLGWDWIDQYDRFRGIKFNLDSFASCRNTLKQIGVNKFGGNADLILVDAHYIPEDITLNFQEAIYVNLSNSIAEKEIISVGEFLQSIINASESIRKSGLSESNNTVVFHISDKLGLATARKSFLDFILNKWGEIIGAKKLQTIAVRSIGPRIKLNSLSLDVVSQGPTSSRDS
jgi:hypothetical protein